MSEHQENYKLNPVKAEIFEKLTKAHKLIREASATHIDGESLDEEGKEINTVMKNPQEYISLLDEIGEKIEGAMQYILDRHKQGN